MPHPQADLLHYGLQRSEFLIAARSALIGWIALYGITFLMERPLLHFLAHLLGPPWLPTARLGLVCAALAATGWLIGRWGYRGVLLFAATLAIRNFGLAPGIDLLWLVRLFVDTFHSARYVGSFLSSLITHVFLLGSLFVGAHLARAPRSAMLRIQ
jgi:hypothetical protein